MAQKLNSEFNYRYQVIGETIWQRIQTLQGFLIGRKRAKDLEAINAKKLDSKKQKVIWLRTTTDREWEALELEAEIMEIESSLDDAFNAYRLNEEEIATLEKLLAEAYAIAEPTRLFHSDGIAYTDEEMFEANAANEFSTMILSEMYSEILANGRPSPAKIKNAMSNPVTWNKAKEL